MKKALLAFAGVFVVFFLAGFLQQVISTHDHDFYIRIIRRNLRVVRRGSAVSLNYVCGDKLLFVYNVDSHALVPTAEAFAPLAASVSRELPSDTVKTGLFTIMLGGGAWSAADAVGMLKSDDNSAGTVIAVVAGALSGYSAGRYVGIHTTAHSACDCAEVMAIVGDPAAWRTLSRDAYVILLTETAQRAYHLSQELNLGNNFDAIGDVYVLQTNTAKRFASLGVGSADFIQLSKLDSQLRTRLSKLPAWKRVVQYVIIAISVIFSIGAVLVAWAFFDWL